MDTKLTANFPLIRWFFFLLLVTLFGCKKEARITGRLMLDCETPISNERISIRQMPGLILSGYGGSFMTDSEGIFDHTFETRTAAHVSLRGNSITMDNIPFRRNLNLGKVVPAFKFDFFILLTVANPYTSQDTLYYKINSGVWNKVPGPFVEGQFIDSLPNFNANLDLYVEDGVFSTSIQYHINKNSDIIDYWFESKMCDEGWQRLDLLIY